MAVALFKEGKALMKSGQLAPACDKFKASLRAERLINTHAQLARCYELRGKHASAVAELARARSLAIKIGDRRRARGAERERLRIAPKVCKLTIELLEPRPGLRVLLNGDGIALDRLGKALPVDEGAHRIVVHAPEYASHIATVRFNRQAQSHLMVVPPLALLDNQSTARGGAMSGQRTVGLVLGGVGLAGALVGTGLMVSAIAECPNQECPGPLEKRNAESRSLAGGVILGVGSSVMVAGIVTAIVAPGVESKEGTSATPLGSVGVHSVQLTSFAEQHGGMFVVRGWF
jgi:hypothetical protein